MRWFCLVLVGVLAPAAAGARVELGGRLALEHREFVRAPRFPGQHHRYTSVVAEPELYAEWSGGRQHLRLTPFLRLDQHDGERTHLDLRELLYGTHGAGWSFRAGLGRVFWGVTESKHLVDVINQTDLVENVDGEDKLGQPLVDLSVIRSWGTLDLFVLPGFRERTFPGREGRLRGPGPVRTEQATFDSGARTHRVDVALRWSHVIGDWDLGLAHFYGTSREPLLRLGIRSGGPALVPHYDVIHQTSIDVQATKGSWLWKLEALRRAGQGSTFYAAVAGFEYTIFGVTSSAADLGLLVEYLYDERGDAGPDPLASDVFAGLRLSLNDVSSTQVLLGLIVDVTSGARVIGLEASRRLGDRWKLAVEARAWSAVPAGDPQFPLRDDDFLQLELSRYF